MPMTPRKFFLAAIGRAWHSALHLSHWVHLGVVLATGAFVVLGVKFGEDKLIVLPFAALVVAFLLGTVWNTYTLHRDAEAAGRDRETTLKQEIAKVSAERDEAAKAISTAKAEADKKLATPDDIREELRLLAKAGFDFRQEANLPIRRVDNWIALVRRVVAVALRQSYVKELEDRIERAKHGNPAHQADNTISQCAHWLNDLTRILDVKHTNPECTLKQLREAVGGSNP
jgi:hypothetical protein